MRDATTRSSDDGEAQLSLRLRDLLAEAGEAESKGASSHALSLLAGAPAPMHEFGSYQYALGAALVRSGDVEAGIAALERAVELEPEVAEFRSNLGAALLERVGARGGAGGAGGADGDADLDRALRILETASKEGPRLPDVDTNLGRALTLAERPHEALIALERALALDSTHVPALYNKAAVHHSLGREQECLRCLDDVLRIAPDFEPALRSRESTLRRLGRL